MLSWLQCVFVWVPPLEVKPLGQCCFGCCFVPCTPLQIQNDGCFGKMIDLGFCWFLIPTPPKKHNIQKKKHVVYYTAFSNRFDLEGGDCCDRFIGGRGRHSIKINTLHAYSPENTPQATLAGKNDRL